MLVAPSVLAAQNKSFAALQKAVATVETADFIHIDIMDGVFVPQVTPLNDADSIKRVHTKLPLEAHLMIAQPDERYIEFIHAGYSRITFHVESSLHPEVTMMRIHGWGAKAGLAINPDTPLERLLPYLPVIDYVLVMSVHPGKSGQTFLPQTIERVLEIKAHNPHLPIAIDGGLTVETAEMVVSAGADILVADTLIHSSVPKEMIEKLRGMA